MHHMIIASCDHYHVLHCVGQFHEDLGKFLTWIDGVNSNLKAAPPPGVEPPEVEKKITKLEVSAISDKEAVDIFSITGSEGGCVFPSTRVSNIIPSSR